MMALTDIPQPDIELNVPNYNKMAMVSQPDVWQQSTHPSQH